MATEDYWVKLRHGSRVLGVGFYITRRYLLTADHCLRRLPDGESEVALVHADGSEAAGSVCERLDEADLALISLIGKPQVVPPSVQTCASGDKWRTPSRPTPSDPHLRGVVEEPSAEFKCVGGSQVEALQLRTDVDLGSYSGYSGSAVERVVPEPGLAGVLQEQYMDRHDRTRATNVLFAITMREALERFSDYFDNPGLGPVLRQAGTRHASRTADVADVLATHTAVLEEAADWQARGLMGPNEVHMIQVNVARSIVEASVRRNRP
jgi:hypothetical protein